MKRNILTTVIVLLTILNNNIMANIRMPDAVFYIKKGIRLIPENISKFNNYKFYYCTINRSEILKHSFPDDRKDDVRDYFPKYNLYTNNLSDSNSEKLMKVLENTAQPFIGNSSILIEPKEEISIFIYGQNTQTKQYTFPIKLNFADYKKYKEGDEFILKIDSINKSALSYISNYRDLYYYDIKYHFFKKTGNNKHNFSSFINYDGNGKFNVLALMIFSILGTGGLITLFIIRKRKQAWA